MQFEWDSEKAEANIAKHRVSFEEAKRFEFDSAYEYEDRDAFGEQRIVSIGFIGDTLHVMVYVERGDAIRVISLRKAEKKEIRNYAKNV
ncbi:BrnT family toxin [Mesorhizobium sp.]|uniref:BrnT family toxin n=1 Tax=Mesorhizobium sp. TaxID=1871066 RepID=UPI000FE58A97|nr:BrnT family toxin [Mesorhizobium sp.]RWE75268.1 MAG: BrnT family toxin [Mesorhizobium sp.]